MAFKKCPFRLFQELFNAEGEFGDMIRNTFDEGFSEEWVEANISNSVHELVIIRDIIPWEKIIGRLSRFYSDGSGPFGKSLRIMIALLIVMKYRDLSDREAVEQVKENRYIQYFCNVPDDGLRTFLHPGSLSVFRKRLGAEGVAIIEDEIFGTLRRAGVIRGDDALVDSTVLNNDIIHPNDVNLLFSAFRKMRQFAKLHKISLWWDEDEIKKLRREFGLQKGANRPAWLIRVHALFVPALKIFEEKISSPETSGKRKPKKHSGF
jgi:hypothetical protein